MKLSLMQRLVRFFKENPDEELTYPDICAKFGCSYGGAKNAVFNLRQEGALECAHVIRKPPKIERRPEG